MNVRIRQAISSKNDGAGVAAEGTGRLRIQSLSATGNGPMAGSRRRPASRWRKCPRHSHPHHSQKEREATTGQRNGLAAHQRIRPLDLHPCAFSWISPRLLPSGADPGLEVRTPKPNPSFIDLPHERRLGGASHPDARTSLYWKCQVVGWSLTLLLTAGIPTLYGGLTWPVAMRAVFGAVLGVGFTDQLRRHMQRRAWLLLPIGRLAPRLVAATVVIAAAMVLAISPFLLMFIPPPNRSGPLAAIFASHIGIVGVWISIYVAVHYLSGLRRAETERWQLELAMRDTELQALRAQLNPHFLFNSLNSLRGLVVEDRGRARDAITGLAALLRYALRQSRDRTTTLEQELDATRHYLELEVLRFEARMAYDIDVEPRALDHPIPPMLVQTIVENAIKHGIARLPQGGVIRLEARKPAETLFIRVTNTGTLRGTDDSPGIGLANSLERLRLIFGDEARIELRAIGANQVACDVVVPPLPISRHADATHAPAER